MSYDAKNYALLIKREVVALDTLLECWGDIVGISNEEKEELAEDTLDEVNGALSALEIEWPDDDGADIVGDYLNGTCLDITVWRKVGVMSDGVTRLEILRTCGGPRCDILRDSEDGSIVEVRVYSGSDSHTLRVNAATLADYLDEMAGGY
ncbi:hypothetical protein UFOVP668_33 [uncultured Caudovirales phage]|uniref:Uncharacterized protein n=1 Tax=uncultured Caudovirales phage TaxID=2100421 RepID=A0A6J5NAF2_9CAUD|nr:hypothetical protein UFOVP668_33 [uncultured Caudovirales phage]